jgi:putative Mn2+ efflux pump MntP
MTASLKAVIVAGAVLVYFGGYGLWEASTHAGPGVVTYGGDRYDGRSGEDEHSELVPERIYKKHSYVQGVMLLIFGATMIVGSIKSHKERERLAAGLPPSPYFY